MELSIQHWCTDNGARVFFVARRGLPTVDSRITFNAGSARDNTLPGLARMTSNLLLEGTAEQTAGDISQALEQHGARVEMRCGRDTADVNIRCLSHQAHLGSVVQTIGECIAGAVFPSDSVDRIRQRMIAGLAQASTAPMEKIEKGFTEAIFGDHPYATSPGGESDSLQAIDPQRLRSFHGRYYVAANTTLTLVGDLPRAQAERVAEQLVAGLPVGERASALTLVKPPSGRTVLRLPFEAEQTHVSIGGVSLPYGHEDHPALHLGCHILGGGGLTSILARRMRRERGLSYSSACKLTAGAAGGRFQMKTHVRNEALSEALSVLRASLRELLDQGAEPDALELARENLLGSLPLQLASNRDLLEQVATIGFHGLPLDDVQRFSEKLRQLDGEEVSAAMRRHLDPDLMATVLVGPELAISRVE